MGTDLEFLQLLQDHVIGHVVKEPVGGGEDDVAELHVEARAVGCVGAVGTHAEVRRSTRAAVITDISGKTKNTKLNTSIGKVVTALICPV